MDLKAVGQRIKSAREAKNLTQEELAALVNCFLQALFGEKCKIFLENVASPNWRKLQGLGWQLFCQLHSHCRPYLVVIA